MLSVTFVCLGNICRSPTAELVFRKMTADCGLSSSFRITSFGTSDWEVGNALHKDAAKVLAAHGIEGGERHVARQLTLREVINNDYVIVMDAANLLDVLRLTGGQFSQKVFRLLSFTEEDRDVADPWYTHDFERAYSDIYRGCAAFLEYLLKTHPQAFAYDKRH